MRTSRTSVMLFKAPDLCSLSPCLGSCPTCTTPNLKMGEMHENMLATHLRMCTYPSQPSQHVSENTRIYLPPFVRCYPTCI